MYHHPPHLVRRSLHGVCEFLPSDRVNRALKSIFALWLAASWGACGTDGTGPLTVEQRIQLLEGDAQVALVGKALEMPLKVKVTESTTGLPVPGVAVQWAISAGEGASLNPHSSSTDEQGVAQTVLILGPQAGAYRASASTRDAPGIVNFGATAIEALSVVGVSHAVAAAGSTIEVTGTGFDAAANPTVQFSGIPGTVVSASATVLTVEVPACLPSRTVDLAVTQSGQHSDPVGLAITATGRAVELAVGEDLVLADSNLLRCRRVSFRPGAEYLAVVRSDDIRGGMVHPYSIRGLGQTGEITTSVTEPSNPSAPRGIAEEWHDRIRKWEHEVALSPRLETHRQASEPALSVPPAPGDMAQFAVLTNQGGLDTVQAVARYVGDHVALYEDLRAPTPGLLAEDFAALAAEFDSPIYDVVTSVFGTPSDVDGNDRVMVLFTPAVNRLTPRGVDGLIAGYFFSGDLLPIGDNPPRGEVFYALVPDPAGEFSDPVDRSRVITGVPAVLAHEFQHMVHFNTRVLAGGQPRIEALWLSEALAQMAEDLVFEHYARAGDPVRSAEYRAGNLDRARRYLRDTGAVSLTVGSGAGTLPERGAGWLFARYLTDHFGGSRVLTDITRGTNLGVENVIDATGEPWSRTFSDWTLALALDGLNIGPPRFSFPSVSLRSLFGGGDAVPVEHGLEAQTFERSGQMHSASARYHSIDAKQGSELAITLTTPDGMASSSGAQLQMRIVRVR